MKVSKFLLLLAGLISARADHDPCTDLVPHEGGASIGVGNGGYYLFSKALFGYAPGEAYSFVLAGESAFEEFIVLAKDGKGNVQGTWTAVDSNKSSTTNCSATLKSSSFRFPDGCSGSSCNYLAEWFEDDGDNILFRLSASTDGWVALALSGDNQMSGGQFDDVIACQAEAGGTVVNAKDMNNPSGTRRNALDLNQEGTTLVEGSVSNGRISCTVRRAISTGDTTEDYPLDQPAFLLFAYGSMQGDDTSILNQHDFSNRFRSSSQLTLTETLVTTNVTVPDSAVIDINDMPVEVQEFMWTAPPTDVGPISFVYSVTNDMEAFIGLNASVNRPPFQVLAAIPEDCTPSTCDYYAAWRQSSDFDFVDFRIEGNVQGWLALGLSEDRLMGGDDVLGCQVDGNGQVNVKDTFNVEDRDQRNNFIDDLHVEDHNLTTQGIVDVTTSNEDGHIACSFSRLKRQVSMVQDRNLNEPSYLFFGLDPDDTAGESDPLSYHNFMTPIVSTLQVTFNLTSGVNLTQLVPENQTGPIFQTPSQGPTPLGSFRSPDGCSGSSCNYLAEWFEDEGDNILFRLSASTDGWVALALSGDNQMSGGQFDDVIACQAEAGGTVVNAKDMNNPSGARTNALDTNQEGTTLVEGSVSNGRISCTVRRAISTGDTTEDYPLDQPAFLLFAYGSMQGDAGSILNYHGPTNRFVSVAEMTTSERATANMTMGMSLGSFRSPDGCSGDSCNYLAEWFEDEGDNILFRLSASTGGWVALALSGDNQMSGGQFDDVIACQAEAGGTVVNAKDMNNPSGARTNALDSNQEGTTLVEGSVSNGRISCTVRRAISTGDTTEDYPLDQPAFLLFAYGSMQGDDQAILNYHGRANRFVSGARLAITAGGDVGSAVSPSTPFIKAHGILMMWAWVLLAATGIFYARYTRPAYVTGQWFEVHRAFLTASVVLTDISFIIIFVGLGGFLSFGEQNLLGSTHFVIGVIVVGFQIYNPIIAAFRCHPGTKLRPIFDIIHGILVGTFVELLSFVNCALGVWIFVQGSEQSAAFYLLIVLLTIVLVFEIGMGNYHFIAKYIVKSLSEPKKEKGSAEATDISLDDRSNSEKKERTPTPPPKKKPSKDALFRKIMAIVYPVVILFFLAIITILIAVL